MRTARVQVCTVLLCAGTYSVQGCVAFGSPGRWGTSEGCRVTNEDLWVSPYCFPPKTHLFFQAALQAARASGAQDPGSVRLVSLEPDSGLGTTRCPR